MLKPKNQTFKVKVMLVKLEIVNNKVASRCHAILKIDNQQLMFKATPQLKKNVALFNSEVQYEHYSLYFDEVTGLYQNKSAVLSLEIQTQGTKVKIGEVQINMGAILNEKKYRIVNSFPLAKCFDKTAKVKLSVDFIPLSAPPQTSQKISIKQKREYTIRDNISNETSDRNNIVNSPSGNNWGHSNFKSRLAEESNYILQEKVYEYEQKMDNYRLSQNQLQQKMHQQISSKDEQITELTMDLNRKNNQIATLNLQNEQMRFRLKEVNDELMSIKENNRSFAIMIQNLQIEEENLKKENQSLRLSIENIGKTKENKEKYFSGELSKYTQRYLESEQERNKIVFELETKFKEQVEKKDTNFRLLINSTDKKYNETILNLRQRTKLLEQQGADKDDQIQKNLNDLRKLNDGLSVKNREVQDHIKRYDQLLTQHHKLGKTYSDQSNELETLNFSYQQLERENQRLKEEMQLARKSTEQQRMELMMANQTIEEQRKSITKFSKELQVHQEREYYLTEKFNDKMEIQSINEENIRSETLYYREQIYKLKNQLRISQQRVDEQSNRVSELEESMRRIQLELNNRNQSLIKMGQQKLSLQTENRNIRSQLSEMEEALIMLKDQNLQLSDYLREKKIAMENDKSYEWSYKIEELQRDISEMVEKFRIEKDLLKDNFKKEENKKKEQISLANQTLRKFKEQNEELKKSIIRKEAQLKEIERINSQTNNDLKKRLEEIAQLHQKIRIYLAEIEQMQYRLRQTTENQQSKFKQLEQKYQRQLRTNKKTEISKININKIISHLLQYITKPFQSLTTYQQIIASEIDAQIVSMVNVSIKRFCEEKNRIRELIKKLQNESQRQIVPKNIEKEYRIEKRVFTQQNEKISKKTYLRESDYEGRRYNEVSSIPAKDNYQLQNYREQNSKLKRQISELRVKMKHTQQDVAKAERNSENERFAREEIKHEYEDLQQELERTSFQLKRKEKIIIQYENQMKDLQTQILAIKSSSQYSLPPKQTPISRSELKIRQKQENSIINRNSILIKSLETKIQQRNQQYQALNGQNSKLKGEIVSLNESISHLNNEIKVYEAKLKQRNAKIAAHQQENLSTSAAKYREYLSESSKQQKIIQSLEEQLSISSQQGKKAEQTISLLEKSIQELQKKVKSIKEQAKLNETKLRRQSQLYINRLKEDINELQNSIVSYKSEVEQLTYKNREINSKVASQGAAIIKRNEEIQKNNLEILSKDKQLAELHEQLLLNKVQYERNLVSYKERLEQVQESLTSKQYELQEYKFTSQGQLMDLEKRLEEAISSKA